MKWLKLFQEVVTLLLASSLLVLIWLVVFAGIADGCW